MRIGLNEVLLYERSSGARQRELVLAPALLHALEAAGHSAVVYVNETLPQPIVDGLVAGATQAQVARLPVPAVPTHQRILRGRSVFPQRMRSDGIDLFHTNYYPLPPVAAPTLLTVHDVRFVHLPETYTRARRAFLHWVVPQALRRAARILADTEDTRRDLVAHFGVAEQKIDVVPIPISPSFRREQDPARLEQIRAKYGLAESYLLFVGHLEPRKNLPRLLRAYAQLCSQQPQTPQLVILGKESFGNEALFAELRAQGLADRVRFTGYVDEADMPGAYSLATLLAFPSLHEGFGVPVLEAMACGVPVVTSNTSALPEVAGGAAVLVDPRDTDSIAQGLAGVLNDAALRARLVDAGYARVAGFTPERSAALTVAAYERTAAEWAKSAKAARK